jgi:hypothetical protein
MDRTPYFAISPLFSEETAASVDFSVASDSAGALVEPPHPASIAAVNALANKIDNTGLVSPLKETYTDIFISPVSETLADDMYSFWQNAKLLI